MFSSFLTLQCCHMTQWQIRRGLLRQEKSPSSEILVNQWVTHKQAFWQLTSANIVLPPGETSGAFSSLKGSISRAHPSSLGSCEEAGCYTTVLFSHQEPFLSELLSSSLKPNVLRSFYNHNTWTCLWICFAYTLYNMGKAAWLPQGSFALNQVRLTGQ